MTTFRLYAYPLVSYGESSYSVELGLGGVHPIPPRTVEAKNVAALVPLMDAYEADAKASGLPLKLACMLANYRDRKPAGFDRATHGRGSPLVRFVNTDKCPEEAFEPVRPASVPTLAQVAAASQAHSKPVADQAGLADTPLFGTKSLL